MLTAVAFLFAYSSACLMALFRHPIYGLITYVLLIYLHPPSTWWGGLVPSVRWSLLAAAITVVAVLIRGRDANSRSIFSFSIMRGFIVFLIWLLIQSVWTINPVEHRELLTLMAKYAVVIWLMVRCIDSVEHLKLFLFAHSVGCFYLGMVVIDAYIGGRFEGFSGAGINEANAAALQLVGGIVVTFAIFLSGKKVERIVAFVFMPFIVNALVATISRSGFLAFGIAGFLFNFFAPRKIAGSVRLFSFVGLILFVAITNPVYWERISTILVAGEEIEGRNTGTGRLLLMNAQLEMFATNPMGCGHRCTATLSRYYLDDAYLTGKGELRARSSHNTFLTLLVEQGIPGVVIYVLLLYWILRTALRLHGTMRTSSRMLAATYAATVSVLGAITVGDLFVDYLKFELRIMFIALLIVIDQLAASEVKDAAPNEKSAKDASAEHRLDRRRTRRTEGREI